MRELSRKPVGWLLASLALLGGGCSGADADILARVGRKVAGKVETLTANSKLASGWQSVRANVDDVAVDARVSARLSWDKSLVGVPIQVHASGGRVELHGTVPGLPQRRRAIELAESTAGVSEVVDALQVP
jgi:osmotically-inducible protein OsmY